MYWAAGPAISVVFFGSLLAHELVARRNRVQVEGIVPWLLGGAARLSFVVHIPHRFLDEPDYAYRIVDSA